MKWAVVRGWWRKLFPPQEVVAAPTVPSAPARVEPRRFVVLPGFSEEVLTALFLRGFQVLDVEANEPVNCGGSEADGVLKGRTVRVWGNFHQFSIEVDCPTSGALKDVSIFSPHYIWRGRVEGGCRWQDARGLEFYGPDRARILAAAAWLGEDLLRMMAEAKGTIGFELREGRLRSYSLDRDTGTEHILQVDPNFDHLESLLRVAAAIEARAVKG